LAKPRSAYLYVPRTVSFNSLNTCNRDYTVQLENRGSDHLGHPKVFVYAIYKKSEAESSWGTAMPKNFGFHQ